MVKDLPIDVNDLIRYDMPTLRKIAKGKPFTTHHFGYCKVSLPQKEEAQRLLVHSRYGWRF
jgi:hypothetical protein